ncbi:hypothetical protein BMS_1671 [Halobacteriovorax marinus SJ]|uniref:Uncharacterized protein n=1 Tax=Halobacteriovorax marinus (strain ATCC BAA-682 / DSM 15412 / SJ) TaxID=862908 RepID=E1X1C0_HALMS|nr:hypothetical protein BMS_1671 [Halobacteriovorax marinus SJ]
MTNVLKACFNGRASEDDYGNTILIEINILLLSLHSCEITSSFLLAGENGQ